MTIDYEQFILELRTKNLDEFTRKGIIETLDSCEIKSHKGGRTEIISAMRVTPSEKQIIDEARKDLSYSDYLVQKALKDVRRKNP